MRPEKIATRSKNDEHKKKRPDPASFDLRGVDSFLYSLMVVLGFPLDALIHSLAERRILHKRTPYHDSRDDNFTLFHSGKLLFL